MSVVSQFQQPQEFRRASRLAVALGFTHIWNFGSRTVWQGPNILERNPVNAVSGISDVNTLASGFVSVSTSIGGVSARFNGSNFNRFEVAGNPFGSNAGGSYVWIESGYAGAYGCLIHGGQQGSGSDDAGFQIRLEGSDTVRVLRSEQAGIIGAVTRVAGRVNVGGMTYTGSNGRHALFGNGVLGGAATPSGNSYIQRTSAIGSAQDSQFAGDLYLLAFSPTPLSDATMSDLTNNPYALLMPSASSGPRRFFKSSATGVVRRAMYLAPF